MVLAAYILSGILVVASVGSAGADLAHHPRVMAALVRLGFQPKFANVLAGLKILGAAGVLLGIWIRPLGIFATECLTVYYLCAMLAHVRVKDPVAEMVPSTVFFGVALAAALTHITA